MKFQAIICVALIQLAIGAVVTSNKEKNYFTLKTKAGDEITGNMAEFNQVLKKLYPELESVPHYEEIIDAGYGKVDKEIAKLIVEGADKNKIKLMMSHGMAEVYEKWFAAAGMDLKINDRN